MFRYDVSSFCVCVSGQDLCTGSLQGPSCQGAGIIGLCDITFVRVERYGMNCTLVQAATHEYSTGMFR